MIREENFKLAHKKGWGVAEKEYHIELRNEKGNLIREFGGHIKLNEYLKYLNS